MFDRGCMCVCVKCIGEPISNMKDQHTQQFFEWYAHGLWLWFVHTVVIQLNFKSDMLIGSLAGPGQAEPTLAYFLHLKIRNTHSANHRFNKSYDAMQSDAPIQWVPVSLACIKVSLLLHCSISISISINARIESTMCRFSMQTLQINLTTVYVLWSQNCKLRSVNHNTK